jgi:23S rRNA (cytosine1962-C5)-methyltransferase
MFAIDEYQLLDFGAGRKLERFGPYVVDRPSPAAEGVRQRTPDAWERADARFERSTGQRGRWTFHRQLAATWPMQLGPMSLALKFTDYGQIGLFPEQARNWDWIVEQVHAQQRPLKVLNLFAYTGGSTLAAAAAGAEVAHVDAAANVVAWARRNAASSRMEEAPIRWITEDALRFARRELKRRNHYDAVILDPPAYGHGPGGEVWKLEEHLGELLESCLELTRRDRAFLLLTCHSGELARAEGLLRAAIELAPELRSSGQIAASDMLLPSAAGGRLPSGAMVRWVQTETAGNVRNPTSVRPARRDR